MSEKRDPAKTRNRLLRSAYEAVYSTGFRAASLTDVLADTGVTKGALYHHFADKRALGYAICDEVLDEAVQRLWVEPLAATDDPLTALAAMVTGACAALTDREVSLGCPLNNLAVEMAPVDEEFRRRIDMIYAAWVDGIAAAFVRGQAAGTVRDDVDAARTALFIVGAIAGARSLAKTARSRDILDACAGGIVAYLRSLRPDNV